MYCQYICGSLSLLGAAYLFYRVLKLATWLKLNYFTKIDIKEKYSKAGEWAVITGASDGIGLAMATDIARRGMNIVIIARTKAKLGEVASALQDKYKVKAHCIAFDFSTAGEMEYEKLQSDMESFDIGVLVNNVGVNYSYPRDYDTTEIAEDLRLLKVNCESQLRMTKMVLSNMKDKKCGGIINLASFAALHPIPKLATYAATKAFNKQFSDSLHMECAPFNIDVLSVTPSTVISRMTAGVSDRKPKRSFMVVDPDEMARDTIDKLGRAMATDGHTHHGIIEGVLSSLPAYFVNRHIYSTQKNTEMKAIKKLSQQKKNE